MNEQNNKVCTTLLNTASSRQTTLDISMPNDKKE